MPASRALAPFLGSCQSSHHEILRESGLLSRLPDGVALEMLDGTDARFSSFAALWEALHDLEVVEDSTITYPATPHREHLVEVGYPVYKI